MTHLTSELAYWINERENIRTKRVRGLPASWSADPIFQNVRFCNVHREDDTVTQWIRKNWNKPDDPAWKFVLGRMINLPESLEEIKGVVGFTLPVAKEILKVKRGKFKDKIFTSAYTISTCGQKMDKLDYVFDVVAAVKEHEYHHGMRYGSLAETAKHLERFKGLGTFLAGQVIADMKNTAGHPLAQAPDWWSWSAPGPGSLHGLSWYFRGNGDAPRTARYVAEINSAYNEVMDLLGEDQYGMHMQDFQNCLCEFSKYMKVSRDPKAHVRNRVHYA